MKLIPVSSAWVVLLLVLLSVGCSSTAYYFAPRPRTELTPGGMLGATFAAPGGLKKSSVRILPLGVKNVQGRRVLPVRYYLDNNSSGPWHLDLAKQKLQLPDGTVTAAEPSPEAFEGKITEVPKGVVRIWDFQFPLPPSISASTDLPAIVLNWEVDVGEPLAGHTTFVPTVAPDEEMLTNPGKGGTKRGRG